MKIYFEDGELRNINQLSVKPDFVIETEKGKTSKSILCDEVYINEGAYDPCIKIHRSKFAKEWYKLFAIDFNDFDLAVDEKPDYIQFFIPESK